MNDLEKSNIEEITKLHYEICDSLKITIDKAIRIGELLFEQKEKLKHGEFIPWIQKNLPFSDRTARRYMTVFDNREKLKTDRVSNLNTAYKLLEEPKDLSFNLEFLYTDLKEGYSWWGWAKSNIFVGYLDLVIIDKTEWFCYHMTFYLGFNYFIEDKENEWFKCGGLKKFTKYPIEIDDVIYVLMNNKFGFDYKNVEWEQIPYIDNPFRNL